MSVVEQTSRSKGTGIVPGVAGILLVVTLSLVTACGDQQGPVNFVARVGDTYLMQEELDELLSSIPPYQDSIVVREQFISRWVTDQLLVQEALRRNLQDDPDVVRRLEENEQAVLISTLVGQMYELTKDPTPSEVRAYYDRNKERLRLREPYVHVRFLTTEDSARADRARRALSTATEGADADTVWADIVAQNATDPDGALAVSTHYFPLSQIFTTRPELRPIVLSLREGELSPVLRLSKGFGLVQVVDRIPEETVPELQWVEGEIRERLRIQSRKQMYADQVERLRNEALAREALETRGQ